MAGHSALAACLDGRPAKIIVKAKHAVEMLNGRVAKALDRLPVSEQSG